MINCNDWLQQTRLWKNNYAYQMRYNDEFKKKNLFVFLRVKNVYIKLIKQFIYIQIIERKKINLRKKVVHYNLSQGFIMFSFLKMFSKLN